MLLFITRAALPAKKILAGSSWLFCVRHSDHNKTLHFQGNTSEDEMH